MPASAALPAHRHTQDPVAGSRLPAVLLMAGSCLPILGAVLIAPVLPRMQDHFRDVPGNAALVPLVLTVPALSLAVLAPFAGALVDRLGRKRLLVAATVLYTLFGTAPLWLSSLYGIVASRVLVGIAEAAIMTCCTTLIGDYYTGRTRDRYLALQTMCASASATAFFVLGGALGSAGWRAPFWLYLVGVLLAPAMARTLPAPRVCRLDQVGCRGRCVAAESSGAWCVQLQGGGGSRRDGGPPARAKPRVGESASDDNAADGRTRPRDAELIQTTGPSPAAEPTATHRRPFPLRRMAGICLLTIFGAAVFYTVPVEMSYLMDDLGVHSTGVVGAATALASAATVLGSVLFTRFADRARRRLPAVLALCAAGFVLMGATDHLPLLIAGAVVNCVGTGMLLPSLLTVALSRLEYADRGRGTGLWTSAFFLGEFACPLALLAVTSTLGTLASAVLLLGALTLLVSTALLPLTRRAPKPLAQAAPESA